MNKVIICNALSAISSKRTFNEALELNKTCAFGNWFYEAKIVSSATELTEHDFQMALDCSVVSFERIVDDSSNADHYVVVFRLRNEC